MLYDGVREKTREEGPDVVGEGVDEKLHETGQRTKTFMSQHSRSVAVL